MLMAAKHVFLSYCRENKSEVAQLRDDLIIAGEKVWWDGDIRTGQKWKSAIRQAMKECYAFVVCFSKECEQRISSGMYPEILDAIEAYRNHSPGTTFIFPVRLSDCKVPSIEIDANTTLDELHYIDLFPPAERDQRLRQLIRDLRQSPLHP